MPIQGKLEAINQAKIDFVDTSGKVILTIDPDSPFVLVRVQTGSGGQVMQLTNTGSLNLGFKENAQLDGAIGLLLLGGDGQNGRVELYNTTKEKIIVLDASSGNGWFGGNGVNGDLVLLAAAADKKTTEQSTIRLSGGGGSGWFGGNGVDGDLVVSDTLGDNKTVEKGTIHLNGEGGSIRVGRNQVGVFKGVSGSIAIENAKGQSTISLKGDGGSGWFGGNKVAGDLVLFAAEGDNKTVEQGSIHLKGETGSIRLGRAPVAGDPGVNGDISIKDHTGKTTIVLKGSDGDIILQNADCAEDFDLSDVGEEADAGTVMVFDESGLLKVSSRAYDRTVAGILSGAGDLRPGIVLGRKSQEKLAGRATLALVGRAYCKVDATHGEIEPGDLLTTSPTPGHAMKASDPSRAFGAVIGKALHKHREGIGLIPVLVSLQ